MVRLEPDGFAIIVQRALQVALEAARNAPIAVGEGKVRLEPDGLAVEAQLFINTGSGKPSLKPLLGRQLFFLDRRSRASRCLLFRSGLLGGERRRE